MQHPNLFDKNCIDACIPNTIFRLQALSSFSGHFYLSTEKLESHFSNLISQIRGKLHSVHCGYQPRTRAHHKGLVASAGPNLKGNETRSDKSKNLLLLVSCHERPQISLRNVSPHVRPEISTAQYPKSTHITSVELLSLLCSPHSPYSLNLPYSPLSPKLNTPSSFKSSTSPKLLYLPYSLNSHNSPYLPYPTHPIQPTYPTRPTYLLIQLTILIQLTLLIQLALTTQLFTLLTQLTLITLFSLLTQHLISFQKFYTGYPLNLEVQI